MNRPELRSSTQALFPIHGRTTTIGLSIDQRRKTRNIESRAIVRAQPGEEDEFIAGS